MTQRNYGKEAAADARIAGFDAKTLLAEADAIRAHRAFPEALRRYTGTALDTFEGRDLDAKLVCQTARYVTLFMILYLHDTADPEDPSGGATVTRLQEIVALGPFASPGWVKLAVRVFHRTGLIEYRPPGPDRRLRRFAPTERLLDTGRQALAAMLGALSLVHPLPGAPEELAHRPGAVEGFARATVEVYLAHRFIVLAPFPEIAALLGRDYGHLIFAHLLRTMREADNGDIVAEAPSGDLARRFGVSRAHVRNVLELATGMDFLTVERKGGHVVHLTPRFVDLCERWVATDLAWMHFLTRTTFARLAEREG